MTKIRSTSSGRVQDRRGQSAGGRGGSFGGALGGGLPIPGGAGGIPGMGSMMRGGGGLMGLLLMAAVFILPKLLGAGGNAGTLAGTGQTAGGANGQASAPAGPTQCSTEIEQIVCGAANSVSEYWNQQLPTSFNVAYKEAPLVWFSDAVATACGNAPSSTGPFYCPGDSMVYIDLAFMQQLQQRFKATGDLASQYIVAHEYGHHVQNLLGINAQVRQAQQRDPSRANQYSIALELQADCFAGAWAQYVNKQGLLEQDEVSEALNAASAVGDDNIQRETTGNVDQDSWTHGSSQQRMDWFNRGFETGDPNRCTTFDEVI